MTKQRRTIEQNPLTEETMTLNASCHAYELPQYSVRERKGSSKSKLYNVYIDDSIIFYGTIHQVKYYLPHHRGTRAPPGEEMKKLERIGKTQTARTFESGMYIKLGLVIQWQSLNHGGPI